MQPPPTIVTIDDSDKENDPDDTQGTDGSRSSSVSETTEFEPERMTSIKRLYSTKQKRVVVAYAKEQRHKEGKEIPTRTARQARSATRRAVRDTRKERKYLLEQQNKQKTREQENNTKARFIIYFF